MNESQTEMATIDRLRPWASGMYTTEAAVELLYATGVLNRLGQYVEDFEHEWAERAHWRWFDFERLAVTARAGLPYSGGELRIITAALSISESEFAADMGWVMSGLDDDNARAVLGALAHAHRWRGAISTLEVGQERS